MLWEQITLRLGLAMLLGAAIGIERQWRSHYVGLRTNTLLSIGAAGLMIFALLLPNDPTAVGRIASQAITGIGFLCAGVIMHEGINVRGFNTAATLWCSVTVGMFTGVGLFMPAFILTALIMLVNLFMTPLVHVINRQTTAEGPESIGNRPQDDKGR